MIAPPKSLHNFLNRVFLWLLGFWLCLFSLQLWSAPVLHLDDQASPLVLGLHLDMIEDPRQQWQIKEVASGAFEDRFKSLQEAVPSYGYTSSAYWFRLRLSNLRDHSLHRLIEIENPTLDSVALIRQEAAGYSVIQSGDRFPFDSRPISYRNVVFPIELQPGEQQTLYFRVASKGSMQIPFMLWESSAFAEQVHVESIAMGAFIGIMLILVLYNAFIYASVRDISYLYYVLYVSTALLYFSADHGLAFELLWPDYPDWSNQALEFFTALTGIWVMLFTQRFLQTRVHVPRTHRLLSLMIVISSVLASAAFWGDYTQVAIALSVVAVLFNLLAFSAGIGCWRQGYRPARFF